MKRFFVLFTIAILHFTVLKSQTVSIVNKKFVIHKNPTSQIYFNGVNMPWEAWNDFGGAYNDARWEQNFKDLHNHGINAARIWISCNGDGQPKISPEGIVQKPSDEFWQHCDKLFAHAKKYGVYIMASMMSFDHTKSVNNYSSEWRKMYLDTNNINSYLNNYLVPFVNRYKENSYLWSIDICNEIEWVAENGNRTDNDKNWGCDYSILQRFVAKCCVALHNKSIARKDGSFVLCTMGSAAVKWNATKQRSHSFGSDWVENSGGNKWSDKNLQKAYAHKDAYLDFYSPHFYGWLNEWFLNPFEKSPNNYGIDEKLCMIGEMPARDPFPLSITKDDKQLLSQLQAYNNLKKLNWHGHMPWTSNIKENLTDEVGTINDFGIATQTFAKENIQLIFPDYITDGSLISAMNISKTIDFKQKTLTIDIPLNNKELAIYIHQIDSLVYSSKVKNKTIIPLKNMSKGFYTLKIETQPNNYFVSRFYVD